MGDKHYHSARFWTEHLGEGGGGNRPAQEKDYPAVDVIHTFSYYPALAVPSLSIATFLAE